MLTSPMSHLRLGLAQYPFWKLEYGHVLQFHDYRSPPQKLWQFQSVLFVDWPRLLSKALFRKPAPRCEVVIIVFYAQHTGDYLPIGHVLELILV
jgi:hypothetical protein